MFEDSYRVDWFLSCSLFASPCFEDQHFKKSEISLLNPRLPENTTNPPTMKQSAAFKSLR